MSNPIEVTRRAACVDRSAPGRLVIRLVGLAVLAAACWLLTVLLGSPAAHAQTPNPLGRTTDSPISSATQPPSGVLGGVLHRVVTPVVAPEVVPPAVVPVVQPARAAAAPVAKTVVTPVSAVVKPVLTGAIDTVARVNAHAAQQIRTTVSHVSSVVRTTVKTVSRAVPVAAGTLLRPVVRATVRPVVAAVVTAGEMPVPVTEGSGGGAQSPAGSQPRATQPRATHPRPAATVLATARQDGGPTATGGAVPAYPRVASYDLASPAAPATLAATTLSFRASAGTHAIAVLSRPARGDAPSGLGGAGFGGGSGFGGSAGGSSSSGSASAGNADVIGTGSARPADLFSTSIGDSADTAPAAPPTRPGSSPD